MLRGYLKLEHDLVEELKSKYFFRSDEDLVGIKKFKLIFILRKSEGGYLGIEWVFGKLRNNFSLNRVTSASVSKKEFLALAEYKNVSKYYSITQS
jgi:hypothetical protein